VNRKECDVRGHWKRLIVLAVVGAVGLTVVAVAVGATRSQLAGFGEVAACGALMNDPEAAEAMSELRTEHRAEMQRWYEKYGSSRSSADARRALWRLRVEHRSDMRALLGQYGIEVREGRRSGGGQGGGCGGVGSGGCAADAQGQAYGGMGSGGGMMGGRGY
jgi:hypothetical protein